MSSKLLITELNELSVSKLTLALAEHDYTSEELWEAIQIERDGQNRSTAILAIENALEGPDDDDDAQGYVVAEGKAVTSRVGILDSGQSVTAEMFIHGEETIATLIERGVIK